MKRKSIGFIVIETKITTGDIKWADSTNKCHFFIFLKFKNPVDNDGFLNF